MRSLVLAVLLLAMVSLSSVASAQPALTPSDRAPLRLEPGELVHPSLGFRLRDVGLVPDDSIAAHVASSSLASSMHAWGFARGDDSVRVVLTASGAPRALSRDMLASTIRRFVSLGAVLSESSHERGESVATLQLGPRTVVARAFPFRDGARGFVLMVTAVHLDGSLARTIAMSLDVPAPAAHVVVESGLSREVIRATIRSWIADVRYCYETALATQPELTGRITASFIIRATGRVQTSAISATTLHDDAVERCVLDVVHSMRFPAPVGGGVVGVNYPFVLTSDSEHRAPND